MQHTHNTHIVAQEFCVHIDDYVMQCSFALAWRDIFQYVFPLRTPHARRKERIKGSRFESRRMKTTKKYGHICPITTVCVFVQSCWPGTGVCVRVHVDLPLPQAIVYWNHMALCTVARFRTPKNAADYSRQHSRSCCHLRTPCAGFL